MSSEHQRAGVELRLNASLPIELGLLTRIDADRDEQLGETRVPRKITHVLLVIIYTKGSLSNSLLVPRLLELKTRTLIY